MNKRKNTKYPLENREINPDIYIQLIFDLKHILEKKTASSIHAAGETGWPHAGGETTPLPHCTEETPLQVHKTQTENLKQRAAEWWQVAPQAPCCWAWEGTGRWSVRSGWSPGFHTVQATIKSKGITHTGNHTPAVVTRANSNQTNSKVHQGSTNNFSGEMTA